MSSRLLLGIVDHRAVLLLLLAISLGLSLDGDNLYILLGTNDMDFCPYEAEAASWDYYWDGDDILIREEKLTESTWKWTFQVSAVTDWIH